MIFNYGIDIPLVIDRNLRKLFSLFSLRIFEEEEEEKILSIYKFRHFLI